MFIISNYDDLFQAGLIINYVGFTYWEWEEGFEILVFEQFALSMTIENYHFR